MTMLRARPAAPALLVVGLLGACQPDGTAPADAPAVATPEPAAEEFHVAAPEPLRLVLAEEDLEELYARDPQSNDRLPGEIVHGDTGERLAVDGLRFRGSSSRFHPKKSFNIRFVDDQEFLFGSNRMNAKALYTDPTLMRETLTLAIWAELDRPAPRTRYVDLWVGDAYEGLYVHVERVDFDLLANAGLPERGTLVRDQFRDDHSLPESVFGYDLDQVADPQSLLADNFNSRGEPDWSAVEDLVRWVLATPAGPEFAEGFAERFEVDVFVDWLAVHEVVGDLDAYGDDYWLYLDHDDPAARWYVIPWDKNLTYGQHFRADHGSTLNDYFAYEYAFGGAAGRWRNRLLENVLATSELAERVAERTLELAERFDREWVTQRSAVIADVIRDSLETEPGPDRFVRHPQNHHGELGRFGEHVEVLADFAELRQAYLERALGGGSGPPYEATAVLDADLTDQRVLLTDTAGWTLAALHLDDVGTGGALTARVEPRAAVDGIDRTFTLTTDTDLRGELTWYYRNEVQSPVGVPEENWYAEDVAVGGQDALVMAVDGAGGPEPLPSTANPFANKVTATVDVEAGEHRFVLVHE